VDVCTRTALAAALFTLAACSGSTNSPTTPTVTTRTGSVSDATSDTVLLPVLRDGVSFLPVVLVRPDLVAATIEVTNGSLTGTVSFAPGTRSAADTFACLMLDVDENSSTGVASAGGDVSLGFDYSVCGVLPRGSATAQVSRLSAGSATGIASVPTSNPSADQLRLSVPLAVLGGDDGRMAFKVTANQWVNLPILNTDVIDWMPDIGRTAGLVR
jgi:hypothetical protein